MTPHSSDKTPALQDLLAKADKIGVYAAGLAGGLSGEFGHPGDDTGRCAVAAFEAHGPDAAADVLVRFAKSYNGTARKNGAELVTADKLLNTCGMALSVKLSKEEIASVKNALAAKLSGVTGPI